MYKDYLYYIAGYAVVIIGVFFNEVSEVFEVLAVKGFYLVYVIFNINKFSVNCIKCNFLYLFVGL